MKSSAKKVELAPYDDLFSTEESRQDAKLEKIREIPLSELHPFKNHPFKVKDDEAMVLLRLILKILAMPLIAAVTLIQWAGIFLTQFSSVIFNLLAGLMFLLSVIGWLMGICTGAETMRMLAVGFVVFIIPHIAEWLIVRIAVINCNLRNFLKS